MVFKDIDHYKSEVSLTIENTQELYNLSLKVKDFNTSNNQISNLYTATIRTIAKNTDMKIGDYPTYEQSEELKNTVVETVKRLQEASNE